VKPDVLLKDASVQNYDAVVFAGVGAFQDYQNEFEASGAEGAVAKKLFEEMLKADKFVTALCGGVAVLADAGVLNGKRCTGFSTAHEKIRQGKGNLDVGQAVVVDGRIVTGRSFNEADLFAQELLRLLMAGQPAKPPATRNRTGKVLYVLSQNGFFWGNYGPVREILEKGGVEVEVASSARTDAQPAPHPNAVAVTPNLLLSDAKANDYDAVIFTGIGIYTPGAKNDFDAEGKEAAVARKFCEEMLKADKYVTGLCGGVCVLADAGILKDREFTGPEFHPSLVAKLMKAKDEGAKPLLTEMVVVSGPVITGKDFNFNREFAQVLLQKLREGRPSGPE
jgi:protease I